MRAHPWLILVALSGCFDSPPDVSVSASATEASTTDGIESTTRIDSATTDSTTTTVGTASTSPESTTNAGTSGPQTGFDSGSGTSDAGSTTVLGETTGSGTGNTGVVLDLFELACAFDWEEVGTQTEVLCPAVGPGVPISVFPQADTPGGHEAVLITPASARMIVGTLVLATEVVAAGELEFSAGVGCMGAGCSLEFGLKAGEVTHLPRTVQGAAVELVLPLGQPVPGESLELQIATTGNSEGTLILLDPVIRAAP